MSTARRLAGSTASTAEAAADLIRELPLPEGADVVVLGDTAYDAEWWSETLQPVTVVTRG